MREQIKLLNQQLEQVTQSIKSIVTDCTNAIRTNIVTIQQAKCRLIENRHTLSELESVLSSYVDDMSDIADGVDYFVEDVDDYVSSLVALEGEEKNLLDVSEEDDEEEDEDNSEEEEEDENIEEEEEIA